MTSIKASEFYKTLEELQRDWATARKAAADLVTWTAKGLQLTRDLQEEADANGVPADAREQLAASRKMLDEGPPDGEGHAVPKEEATPAKPRLPKGLMAKMREMCAVSPRAFASVGSYADAVIEEAARKAGLSTWATQDSGGACFFFGLPEHAPKVKAMLGAQGYELPDHVRSKPAVQERRDEGRAADGARVELAGRIRRELPGWNGMLASEVATALGVPMADVVAAWPLLASGE